MSRSGYSNDDWKSWCRLCAKEDTQNIDVLSGENITLTPAISSKKHSKFLAIIEEFFQVYIEQNDDLPHLLCVQCLSLVSALVKFSERVKTVQDMYDAIQYADRKTLDLRGIREKFNVFEDELFMFNLSETKSTVENVVDEDINVLRSLDDIMKSEIMSDEVQSGVLCNEIECKKEFQDPFVDVVENIGSEVENVISTSSSKPDIYIKVDEDETMDNLNEQHISYNNRLLSSKEESTEDEYFCVDCSSQFQRLSNYRTHLKKKHGRDLEPVKCPECPKSFVGKQKLDLHIKSHRPLSERCIFPCPECDQKFQHKASVSTHIKHVHEDIRPFICEECGEGARTKARLRMHMLVHSDLAPFKCDVCEKAFKDKKHLKNHMEIHSSSKYTCSDCGLQLNSRVTLRQHMIVHSDITPHKCDYCGSAFKRAKSLKSHLILHSGLRPYPCEFCEKTFTSRTSSRSHMKRIHPDQFAALEASGEKAYTKDVPKLAVLKTVMQSTELDLKPVVQKRRVNFPLDKKPKTHLIEAPTGATTTADKNRCFGKKEGANLSTRNGIPS